MKKLYIFDYIIDGEDAWMAILFKDGVQTKYWCCDEHDYESIFNYCDEYEIIKTDDSILHHNIFSFNEEDIKSIKRLK